jgi:hypothetical protein
VAVAGETVAVNVTFWRKVEGLGDEARVVVVGALPTVCVRLGEVLTASFSPPL